MCYSSMEGVCDELELATVREAAWEMEEWPSEIGLQGRVSNHLERRRLKPLS